jgi:hypothetical protein
VIAMRGLILSLAVGICLLAGTAEARSPATLSDAEIEKLQVGVTTYAEVIAKFGHPAQSEVNSDGSRTLVYATTRTHLKMATFVPIVGLFAGGAKADVTTQRLDFGGDGKLVHVINSASHIDCGTWGGCSGAAAPPLAAPMVATRIQSSSGSAAAPAPSTNGATPAPADNAPAQQGAPIADNATAAQQH